MKHIIDDKPDLNALVHYGVKGMKWGVRREQTPQSRAKQLKKVNRKISKIDMNSVIEGYSYQGWAKKKMAKKAIKKDPKFAYNKLSKEEQKAWDRKANRKATRKVALSTGIDILAIAGMTYGVGKIDARPETIRGAQVSTILLGGTAGSMHVRQLKNLRDANKFDKLKEKRDELQRGSGKSEGR